MSEHDELVERVASAMAERHVRSWDDLMGQEQEHYLAHARDALDVLAPELRHDPPEGCEWVALPTETVDEYASRGDISDRAFRSVVTACRATQANRPKPEPRTEPVAWGVELFGRRVDSDLPPIDYLAPGGVYGGASGSIRAWEGCTEDGTVEVLVEDQP